MQPPEHIQDRLVALNSKILELYRSTYTVPNSAEFDELCSERDDIQRELRSFFMSFHSH